MRFECFECNVDFDEKDIILSPCSGWMISYCNKCFKKEQKKRWFTNKGSK